MSDDKGECKPVVADSEIDRLNDDYCHDDIVFVRKREREIDVYEGEGGEPTGAALMQFENIEDADEWAWERHLQSQEEPADG